MLHCEIKKSHRTATWQ